MGWDEILSEQIGVDQMEKQKWEYRANTFRGDEGDIEHDEQYEEWLAEVGEDGWELVSVTEGIWIDPEIPDVAQMRRSFYFKRPK